MNTPPMMVHSKPERIIPTALLAATLPLLLLLISLDSVWTNMNNYEPVFKTNQFDYGSAVRTTQELMSYFRGRGNQPFNITGFSPKEEDHLRDVKYAFHLGNAAFSLLLMLWIGMFLWRPALTLRALALGGIITLAGLWLASLLSFDTRFLVFHSLLFKPQTWVFSPQELLVTIYPEQLFAHLAELIAQRAAGLGALCIIAGLFLQKSFKKSSTPPRGRH